MDQSPRDAGVLLWTVIFLSTWKRASEWSSRREKRSWEAGGERKNPDKDVVSLANSYDWSKVHLWTFQSHEPINLPLCLTWLKASSSRVYNQMNSDQLPSTGTWGVGVGEERLVPLGTLNALSWWQRHYRKECRDPHLLTLLTFLCNSCDFCVISPLVTKFPKHNLLLEHIPLIHSTMVQESTPSQETSLSPVALKALRRVLSMTL